MSATATIDGVAAPQAAGQESLVDELRRDPGYQAFWLMRITFTIAPILFGADKFANVLVDWEKYLAPWIRDASPLSATGTMHVVGAIEIVAGIAVALKPRYAAYIVAAWLAGIVINLLSYSGFYDVALRDFGLMMGALTLARLASKYDSRGLKPTLRRR